MSEQNIHWAELAALAPAIPEERRRQIKERLGFDGHPRYNLGLAAGVVRSYEAVSPDSPEAVTLREMAAVAAAVAVEEERAWEYMRRPAPPEERAETDALIGRIERGEEKLYPFEQVLADLDEILRGEEVARPVPGSD